jgi:hypothetical protein
MKCQKISMSLITAMILACGSDRVHRSSLESWKTIELRTEGISLEIPVDSFDLQLHYKSNGLADATWMIVISVRRVSQARFDSPPRPSQSNPVSADAGYMRWQSWLQKLHPVVSSFTMPDGSKHYRRDVTLANGDIASIHVVYRDANFLADERLADETAISRVLNSARRLD